MDNHYKQMSQIIRFTLDYKNITLLFHTNGSVSMLRNGDTTYSGSPPTWNSLVDWSDDWSNDDRALMAAYTEILPNTIDANVKNVIIFMKKNHVEPNLSYASRKAKTDYLFVKTADDLVPLYVSCDGLLKYKEKSGYNFAAVGLSEPDIWLLDKTDTLIRYGGLAIEMNVVEDEALKWEVDEQGTYRWLHPIYRWVTEKDAHIIPEWLKKMVESHPKFRGWLGVNTIMDPPSTTCCPDISGAYTCDVSGSFLSFSNKYVSAFYSVCDYKDISGTCVNSVCDNSGTCVNTVCDYKDISGTCVNSVCDNSGNCVNSTISGNLNPGWSTYSNGNSTFTYSTTTQSPDYDYYNDRLNRTGNNTTGNPYYDYDNLNSWQNKAYLRNSNYMIYTTVPPVTKYDTVIREIKRKLDKITELSNEQNRLVIDVKYKLNNLPNAVMDYSCASTFSTCSTNVSSFLKFDSPNFSTNVSSFKFDGPNYSTNVSSFLKFDGPNYSTNVSSFLNVDLPSVSTINGPSISTLTGNKNLSTMTVGSGGCCSVV